MNAAGAFVNPNGIIRTHNNHIWYEKRFWEYLETSLIIGDTLISNQSWKIQQLHEVDQINHQSMEEGIYS